MKWEEETSNSSLSGGNIHPCNPAPFIDCVLPFQNLKTAFQAATILVAKRSRKKQLATKIAVKVANLAPVFGGHAPSRYVFVTYVNDQHVQSVIFLQFLKGKGRQHLRLMHEMLFTLYFLNRVYLQNAI